MRIGSEDGGSVDDRDEADGNTALMVASGKCRLPILEFLLDSGTGRPSAPASLELQNELGYTALMLAAAYNQIPCVMKLLRAGANATAQALDGRTALQIARDRKAVDAVALLEREAARAGAGACAPRRARRARRRGRAAGEGGGRGDERTRALAFAWPSPRSVQLKGRRSHVPRRHPRRRAR